MKVTGSVAGSASGMLSIEGDGDKIDVTQVLTEGTKIATITINEGTPEEESVDLYAPEGFSGSWNDLTDKPDLFSGSYNDLTNKPTLNGNTINGNMFTENYSTTEKRVGTWVDGKPLYQKTFSFTVIGTNTYQRYNHDIANIDNIFIDMGASFVVDSLDEYFPLAPYTTPNAVNSQINCFVNATGFDYRANSMLNDATCYVTLKYTKTTDSSN